MSVPRSDWVALPLSCFHQTQMVMVGQSPAAFFPHGTASEGQAPRPGSHRPRVAPQHSADKRPHSLPMRGCQTVWLRKKVVVFCLADRASALLAASQSNLLSFLMLPLGRPLHSQTISPLLAWPGQKADSDIFWTPCVTRTGREPETAWLFVFLFFYPFFFFFFLRKEQNKKEERRKKIPIIRGKRAESVPAS